MPAVHAYVVFRWLGALSLVAASAIAVRAQSPPGEWVRSAGVPIDPNGSRYDDIWFVDSQHGWTGDSRGRVYATTDGGTTWELREVLPAYVRSMAFLTPEHGFLGAVVAPGEVLLETTDGGYTFANITERISEPRPIGLCGLWVVDAQTVVGLGYWSQDPYFIRTTDGGATWSSQDLSGLVDGLVDARFFDSLNGIAVGRVTVPGTGESHAAVIRTEDGGSTWSMRHVSSGADEWAWKVSFPTADVGYVAVQGFNPDDAKILKTLDGGLTWTELPLPPGMFFSGVGFIDEASGWVGGSFSTPNGFRSLAVTTDGGASWSVIDDLTDPSVVNRIRFFSFGSDVIGWASGGAVYRYQAAGTPTSPAPEEPGTILGAPVPNPFVGETHLPFTLARAGQARLDVYDALGRHVTTLLDGGLDAGRHEVRWDGTDDAGRPLAAGLYVYQLRAGGHRRAGEVILYR